MMKIVIVDFSEGLPSSVLRNNRRDAKKAD